MATQAQVVKVKETIPLWLAVAITVVVSIPFGLWLGRVYSMRWSDILQKGSLPLFNGISMMLALYFSGAFPKTGDAFIDPWVAGLWTILSGWFGALLGWFNVTITFPREVSS